MKKQLVGYEVDLANLTPLTDAQRAELSALPARPDTEIDYSDAPQLTEDFWKTAAVGPFAGRPQRQRPYVLIAVGWLG